VQACRIPEASHAVGRSIGQLQVRSTTGATVIAVRRGGRTVPSPGPDFIVATGDEVTVVGTSEQQAAARRLLSS
jgi:K+/H+ antiporter YhaU regulatory subunit KhtT